MKYLLLFCIFLAGCNTAQVAELDGKYFCRTDTGKAYEAYKPMGGLIALRELSVADYLCNKFTPPQGTHD